MTASPEARRLAASLLGVGFDGLRPPAELADVLREGVRCVVLFARNYESPAQVAELIASLRALAGETADDRLLVCVDHEGGRVQRFREGFTAIPSMRDFARGGPRDGVGAIEAAAATIARELRSVGVDLDFAPVLDVDTNPANPVIGDRSFSADPEVVATLGAAFIRALRRGGVHACGKHFPGHGDTAVDSHLDLPRIAHPLERLERVELVPFRAAIAAGVDSIMTAHVVCDAIDPARPATLSEAAIDGLLRRRLGFDGVVFSDDLEMKAIDGRFGFGDACVAGVRAGCDLLLCCRDPSRQREAIEALAAGLMDGAIARERGESALRRRRALAARRAQPSR